MSLSGSWRTAAGILLAGGAFALAPLDLQAQSPPANDNFANAIVINGSSESTNVTFGSSVGATRQSGEPFHGHGSGTSSVWWSWTATATRSISISTAGSSYDTLLGVYTGDSVSSLASVTVNDDDGNLKTSRVLFRAIAGETYLIAVDGFLGETGDIRLTIAPAGIETSVTWQAVDIFGSVVRSTDLRDRVLLINFWSYTCPPCLEELPYIATVHNRVPRPLFQVVGLYKNTTFDQVQGLMGPYNINFPMAELKPDAETVLAVLQPEQQLTIQSFPTTYVYDRENRLVTLLFPPAKDLAYFENLILPLVRTSNSIRLKANWAAEGLHLTWPGADKGDIVESASDLSSTNWTQVLNIFGQTGMTIPPGQGSKFYRVRRPLVAPQ